MKTILGTKLAMTQVHGADGVVRPVTAVKVGPCYVTQIRTKERDGYTAVQLAYGSKKHLSKGLRTHFSGIGSFIKDAGFRYVKEARLENVDGIERGDVVDATCFSVGEKVDAVGWSKGKGFAGVVKRHHFHGHPKTHGHKDQERMPGSIGAGGVQHVFKGQRMAGRMGNDRVTVKNLEIIDIDESQSIIYVKGAVPGARNGLIILSADVAPIFKKGEEVVTAAPVTPVVSGAPEADETTSSVDETPEPMSSDAIEEAAIAIPGSPQEETAMEDGFVASQDEPTETVDETTGEVKSDTNA